MSNHDTALDDLDPTEADLLAAEDDDLDAADFARDDFDLDFDSNYEDERYGAGRNGMPSYSIYGNL